MELERELSYRVCPDCGRLHAVPLVLCDGYCVLLQSYKKRLFLEGFMRRVKFRTRKGKKVSFLARKRR
jgi:hypothetical protein